MRVRYLIPLLLIVLIPVAGISQELPLPVVPHPQEVDLRSGWFTIDPAQTTIRVTGGDTTGLMLPVFELQQDYELISGGAPRFETTAEQVIWLGLPERDREFEQLCRSAGLWPEERLGEEGYGLLIEPDRIIIAANATSGVFYGVQTLKQLLRAHAGERSLPALKVIDWPDLRYRGTMDDISRGPVPTLSYMKEQVRRMAELKLNVFTHYVENVVRTEQHGEFAPPAGSLSIDEWHELSEYARRYHVMVVGNFQSFGHFEKILTYPRYSHLGESGRLLSPVLPESAELLRDVYEEMVPAFDAPFFAIDADETFDLGRGASKQRVDSLGKGVVYAEHILRLHAILKDLGVRTIMWGDIVLEHPEVLDMLPRDIVMGTWVYDALESFDDYIVPFKEAGLDILVTPGVLNSDRIMPDYREAFGNIRQFVADGVRHDVMGMFNTVWDDGGTALFERDWYGVAYAADQSWNSTPEYEHEAFDTRLSRGVYGDPNEGLTQAIWKLVELGELDPTDEMNEKVLWRQLVPDRGQVLRLSMEGWQDVMERVTMAEGLLDQAQPLLYQDEIEAYRFTIALYRHIAESLRAMLEAGNAYREASLLQREDPVQARKALVSTLHSLATIRQQVEHLSSWYTRLWLRENRTSALEEIIHRFETRSQALQDAEERVLEAIEDFDGGHFLPPPIQVRLAVEEQQGRYFREWIMSGPLPNPNGSDGAEVDYLEAMGGELSARPGVAVEWDYDGRTYRWHRMESPLHAEVDLAALYPEQTEDVAIYAYATIDSPLEKSVRATFGSNDGVEVILNGERIHRWHGKRNLSLDEHEAWLPLREGRNHLLLKVSQGAGGWGFSFRLPDVDVRSHKNRYRIIE